MGPKTRGLLALALFAVVLVGCSGAKTDHRAGRGAPAPLPADARSILARVREPGASVVLLNVWASWCGPCREEFPDMLRLAREYRDRGLRLVLVSTDFEVKDARRYLDAQGVDFETWLKTGSDQEFIDGLHPGWSGALPATFVYDRDGRLRYFHEGRMTYADFEKQVLARLQPASSPLQEDTP